MQASLNQLVSMLSDRVGQPFNRALQEELKVVINYKLADFFRKSINNDPSQRKYFQRGFIVDFKPTSTEDCPAVLLSCGCPILRSTKQVPKPTRTRERLFDFVGSKDGSTAIGYAMPEQIRLLKHSPYTGNRPKYFYSDNYLYLLNSSAINQAYVRGLFTDPRDLKDFTCDDDNTPCYTDDEPFDAPDDLINAIITDILRVELRALGKEAEEVTVDGDENS